MSQTVVGFIYHTSKIIIVYAYMFAAGNVSKGCRNLELSPVSSETILGSVLGSVMQGYCRRYITKIYQETRALRIYIYIYIHIESLIYMISVYQHHQLTHKDWSYPG